MFGPQQVPDGLDRGEGFRRRLDEEGQPVSHAAIPQTRMFQGADRLALVGLVRDEVGVVVAEVGQTVRVAVGVA